MQKKNIDDGPAPVGPAPAGAAQPGATDQFLSTLSLVCRIPLPCSFTFSARRMDLWLPVTAPFQTLIFALGLGFFGALFRDLNIALVAALITLYGGFNLFHFDGLLDSADAFLGAFDRDKRLAILKDPRLGVYGVFTAFMYLAFKLMILKSILDKFFALLAPPIEGLSRLLNAQDLTPFRLLQSPAVLLSCILIFPLAGKTAAALIPALFPPAKQEGLGVLAAGSRSRFVAAGFLLAFAIYILLFFSASALFLLIADLTGWTDATALFVAERALRMEQTGQIIASPQCKYHILDFSCNSKFLAQLFLNIGLASLFLSISALFTSLFLGRLYKKGLGGYTGDTLGAAVELGELVYLAGLLILVQWGL